ncbi:EF-hand domain-containing protein [Oceanihabitans sp. 2_MG-2023]|uniref:EF-hand domain-containing protein n=1 Tax=Oceanihabitans sp. 2_MG-2023 TaxID=3062661 RepID=UPI0026E34250|nr:EF-hand domain-containing protein [Oceanihabitans sp. 2_MG-2023]MDO6596706.1 EF-hand domain-containing protein [Oceanihabitans sp. 2_MG-2023]
MKKQFLNLVIVASIVIFTSCKSSNDKRNIESNNTEKTEKKEQQKERGERPDTAQILAQMDADKDGKISKEEAKGPLQEQFSKIDTNQDNYISKEELENAPKPERGGGQGGRPQGGRN